MAEFANYWLPHLGAALVIASIALALTARFSTADLWRRIAFPGVLVACLVPLPEYSISHYARVLTGDLSITGLVWLSWVAALTLKTGARLPTTQSQAMALVTIATAFILYPTALGLTWFDLYAFGFEPVFLAPIVFALFAYSLWYGYRLPVTCLSLAFISFALGLLESDNLWDYLVDPVITIYAIYVAVISRRHIIEVMPDQKQLLTLGIITIASCTVFGLFQYLVYHS